VRNAYLDPGAADEAARRDRSRHEARATDQEVLWAASRIGRTGRLHENEMALINFLKSLDAHRHPRLIPVLDRAAA
jgi:predicted nucleic acid-binding protein